MVWKPRKLLKGKEGFKTLDAALQYIKYNNLEDAAIFEGPDIDGEKEYTYYEPLKEIIVTAKYPRKILKTININNGTLTFEEDNFREKGWYRNHRPIPEDYKYWDPNLKAYRVLDSYRASSHIYTPYLSRLENEALPSRFHGLIPIGNKYITLRTKGKMNLADVPVNLLDSIAINTGRSNTNIKTNLGLVGKESTFGRFSKALGNPLNSQEYLYAYDLTNNHAYTVNPQLDYLQAINRKFPKLYNYDPVTKNDIDKRDVERELEAKKAYLNNLIKSRTKLYHHNSLADAFARYADNPSKYNPGQSNYVRMVTNIGNEVWNEPLIQNWWNTEGVRYYNKGKLESSNKK